MHSISKSGRLILNLPEFRRWKRGNPRAKRPIFTLTLGVKPKVSGLS